LATGLSDVCGGEQAAEQVAKRVVRQLLRQPRPSTLRRDDDCSIEVVAHTLEHLGVGLSTTVWEDMVRRLRDKLRKAPVVPIADVICDAAEVRRSLSVRWSNAMLVRESKCRMMWFRLSQPLNLSVCLLGFQRGADSIPRGMAQ